MALNDLIERQQELYTADLLHIVSCFCIGFGGGNARDIEAPGSRFYHAFDNKPVYIKGAEDIKKGLFEKLDMIIQGGEPNG